MAIWGFDDQKTEKKKFKEPQRVRPVQPPRRWTFANCRTRMVQ